MRYILSTVGISSLTNGLRGVFNIKDIYNYSNLKENELNKEFKARFDKEFDKLIHELNKKSDEELKKLSAEINALFNFYKNSYDKSDYHELLVTDTYLGKKASEIVKTILESKGFSVNILTIPDLKTSSIEEFHISLSENLIPELFNRLEWYRDYEKIFNLTGGFKSVNAFLQSLASIIADKSIYIFETSDEVLVIPKLPVKVDYEIFSKNFDKFRKLELGIPDDFSKIPKSLVIEFDGEVIFSAWGKALWEDFKKQFFKKKLLPIVTDKIEYNESFKKDFESLNPKEKLQINEKIALLEQYLYTNDSKYNLSSLRFHDLSGAISEKYNSEFYPFDGNDSRRVYCNKFNDKLILEKIDSHLK